MPSLEGLSISDGGPGSLEKKNSAGQAVMDTVGQVGTFFQNMIPGKDGKGGAVPAE